MSSCLVIFEELKTRIRRGETREPFAGGELYYSGSRDREEIVQIKGRTNKNINILVRERVCSRRLIQANSGLLFTKTVTKKKCLKPTGGVGVKCYI